MEIRIIDSNDDRKKFRKLARYCYTDWQGNTIDESELSYIIPGYTLGVFDGENLISGLIINPLSQSIRGTLKKMGGIGSIATYPEYRGQGLVSKLMHYSFEEMHRNNIPLTMLDPFKQSFYERYGYINATHHRMISFPTTAIKHYSRLKTPANYIIDRKTPDQAFEEYDEFIKDYCIKAYPGYVVNHTETHKSFTGKFNNNIIIFIKHYGKIQGLARYSMRYDGHKSTIYIDELHWKNPHAKNMLLKYFATHMDQIDRLSLRAPYNFNIYSIIKDSPEQIDVRINSTPWMVRIIDVCSALCEIPVNTAGAITIEVIDQICPWNNEYYKITADNNNLTCAITKDSPDVTIDIRGLTALLYGTNTIEDIIAEKWLSHYSDDTIKILKNWFPACNFHTSYDF